MIQVINEVKTAAERFRERHEARRAKERKRATKAAFDRYLRKRGVDPRQRNPRAALVRAAASIAPSPRAVAMLPPAGSNPQRTLAVLSVYDVSRSLNCVKYDDCLDFADRKKWSGFHCDSCKFHVEEN